MQGGPRRAAGWATQGCRVAHRAEVAAARLGLEPAYNPEPDPAPSPSPNLLSSMRKGATGRAAESERASSPSFHGLPGSGEMERCKGDTGEMQGRYRVRLVALLQRAAWLGLGLGLGLG